MEIKDLKKLLEEFGDNVRFEYDLKKKNWFNIGGKSKVYYKADNLKDLVNCLENGIDSVALGTIITFNDNNIIKIKQYIHNAGFKVRM